MRKLIYRSFLMMLAVFCCVLPIAQSALAQSGVNVFVHSVDVSPIPGKLNYQVEMYVSVWEGDGNPVSDLAVSNFSVQQDAREINLKTVEALTDSPGSIVLAIDSSRWTSDRMGDIRKATLAIVDQMSNGDRIAVVDFNSKVSVAAGFTDDMNTARAAINAISPSQEGACLLDGLNKSLELIHSEPVGRRAVIVFSAGKDVLYSDIPCSKNDEEQVMQLATSGNSRIPIYAIGSTEKMDILDRQRYDRLATLTGGLSIMPADFEVNRFIEQELPKILDQIKVQYRLTFETEGTAGEHQFSVKAGIGNATSQGNMSAFFPELPPLLQFDSPKENDTADKSADVAISTLGKTDSIEIVRLELNGESVSELADPPYNFSIDLSSVADGLNEIKAVAVDKTGKTIAEQAIHINVSHSSIAVSPTSPTSESNTTASKFTLPDTILGIKTNWAIMGMAALVLAIIVGVIVIPRLKTSKKEPITPAADATIDGIFIASECALVSVLFSDDPLRIGEKIPLVNQRTTIGRNLDNDIVFDKDSPVSRHHIEIEKTGQTYSLSEVVGKSSGGSVHKYPSYGTFINDSLLAHGDHAILKSGDEIRLGTRLKLSFETPQSNNVMEESGDVTMDGFETDEITR